MAVPNVAGEVTRILCALSDEQQLEYQGELNAMQHPSLEFVFESSGAGAIDLVGEINPALLIVGMDIGDMEGLEFVALLMNQYQDFAGKVVVLPNKDDPFPPVIQHRDHSTGQSSTKSTNLKAIAELVASYQSTATAPGKASPAAAPAPAVALFGDKAPAPKPLDDFELPQMTAVPQPAAATPAGNVAPPSATEESPRGSFASHPANAQPASQAQDKERESPAGVFDPRTLAEPEPGPPPPDDPAPNAEPILRESEPPDPSKPDGLGDSPLAAQQPAQASGPNGKRIAAAVVVLLAAGAMLFSSSNDAPVGAGDDSSPTTGEVPTSPADATGDGKPTGAEPVPSAHEPPEAEADGAEPPTPAHRSPGLEAGKLTTVPVRFAKGRVVYTVIDADQLTSMVATVVTSLAGHPDSRVEVGGHASSDGSGENNLNLGRRRAIKIRAYLIEQGIPSARIKIRNYHTSKPVTDMAAQKANRRVTLRLSN